MSDYRFSLVKYNGIDCVHVLIDAEPLAETHIPLDDILDAAVAADMMGRGEVTPQVPPGSVIQEPMGVPPQ